MRDGLSCPITLLPAETSFEFRGVVYDAHALSEYIMSSGDVLDPCSRIPLSERDVSELDAACSLNGSLSHFVTTESPRVRRKKLEDLSIVTYLERTTREQLEKNDVCVFETIQQIREFDPAFSAILEKVAREKFQRNDPQPRVRCRPVFSHAIIVMRGQKKRR
jgi:hypothetical protein